MPLSSPDKKLFERTLQNLRDGIRKKDRGQVLTSFGIMRGTLIKAREWRPGSDIEMAMSKIENLLDFKDEKELQEKFIDLEKLLVEKFGLRPSK